MKIKNRSASVVGYTIPDSNIRRRFAPGEVKDISKDEVEKLLYQPGGRELFMDDLQAPADVMKELGFNVEPEYFYSHDDVKELMINGSLDAFLDFLDFAPTGAVGIAKDLAIKLPLADRNKAEALKKATGFDANKAIQHNQAVEDSLNGDSTTVAEPRKRRVEQPTTEKYKIIQQ
jgi:predicted lactoylglutathione lyase